MRILLAAAVLSTGSARADVATPKAAPAKIAAGAVPRVLLDKWRKAENRAGCAPVWFDDVPATARVRARYFAGGWGVTVRNPSRWGIAGAGVIAAPSDLEKWKFRSETVAGIRAGYGLEGFTMGPDWLAYIHVPGQSCMYNLWSSVGKAHLEERIDHLRVVDVR
ncbi:MAG: hypothetical protein ACXVDD_09405 [Polyangia bacterium]